MRKFLAPLLLASALVPVAALAQDGGHNATRDQAERAGQRDNSSKARSQRQERVRRVERAERAERATPTNDGPAKAERAPRIEQSNSPEPAMHSDRPQRGDRPARTDRTPADAQPVQQMEVAPPVQSTTPTQSRPDGLVDAFRQVGRGGASNDGDHDDHHDHDWSRDWRKDHRYDWRHHRSRHRSLFRLGYYYDPYGWGYRRWSIGYSMWPSYYGSSFWLNDPWMYRLPPAYGPYRWVRYYDDALLVNIYTGQVVDIIYNFFW